MPKPRLIVFSGAGLSAESGLATFRGPSGLWEGVSIYKVCHIDTWEENFEAVHEFYDARRVAGAGAEPNAAHRAIAAWQNEWPDRTIILTQNIDRLLERSGCKDVIKLHGNILTLRCVSCGHQWEISGGTYDQKGCPSCHRKPGVKPAIVFFGEQAPLYTKLHEVAGSLRSRDTVIVVGTSGAVLPADRLFAMSDAYSVLVNLEPGTQMRESSFSERRYGLATEQVPGLTELIRKRMA